MKGCGMRRDYEQYLCSREWKIFRTKYYENPNTPHACLLCDVPKPSLCHITRQRLGKERIQDVIPLCSTCRERVRLWLAENNRSMESVNLALRFFLSKPRMREVVSKWPHLGRKTKREKGSWPDKYWLVRCPNCRKDHNQHFTQHCSVCKSKDVTVLGESVANHHPRPAPQQQLLTVRCLECCKEREQSFGARCGTCGSERVRVL